MKPITVLLAEDHMIVREGLRALLEAEGDIEVVGEAQTGCQAVQLTKKLRPGVVVMDIAMPLLNGLEATRRILKAVPATRVLILSAHGDDECIRQVVMLGAAGYLIKQTSADLLSRAIREVQKGNTFFSPSIANRLHSLSLESPDGCGVLKKKKTALSSREVEGLQLIAEGKANKQVAAELGISIKKGGEASAASHEQAGPPRHRGPHAIRNRSGDHRKPRPGDHHLTTLRSFLRSHSAM